MWNAGIETSLRWKEPTPARNIARGVATCGNIGPEPIEVRFGTREAPGQAYYSDAFGGIDHFEESNFPRWSPY
jgi:hypothetical protein